MKATKLVLLLALLLTFGAVAAQDENIVIDFYYPLAVDGPLVETINGYAADFMEQNPGITINPVYTGSYTQTRDTIRAEGEAPVVDVAVMLAIDLYSFIEEGTIIPLDEYLSDEQIADTFPALLENSVDEEGTLWSVPFQRSTPVLFYNAQLLAEAGFENAPQNNEELLEMAMALETDDRCGLMLPVQGGFPIWIFESFVDAYGQPLTNPEDPATVYFNTPEALGALDYMLALWNEHGICAAGGSAWGDTPTAFLNGQAAMIYHTTGSLSNILNNASFEVGVAFTPSGPAGEDGTGFGTPTGGGNLYIFDDGSKSDDELAAAWAWVEYLSSPEVQSDWGVASGYVAARMSAWELEPLAARAEEFPQYAVARDQLEIADREFASYRTIDVQNIINSTLSSILSGQTPAEEIEATLASAQEQIDGLLEEYR